MSCSVSPRTPRCTSGTSVNESVSSGGRTRVVLEAASWVAISGGITSPLGAFFFFLEDGETDGHGFLDPTLASSTCTALCRSGLPSQSP